MNWKSLIFILTLQVIFASQSWSARPLFTDDYMPVDPDKYNLEIGYASVLNPVDPDEDKSIGNTAYAGYISLKHGIFSGLDFGLDLPFSFSSPLGMNDSIIHAKYRIAEFAEDEGVSIRADVKVANCNMDEGYGTGDSDYSLFLIYSKQIGKFHTDYNFGYSWTGITKGEKEGEEDNITTTSASVVYPLFGEMGDAVAEVVMTNAPNFNTGFAQVGARYNMGLAMLDAGYSFGLNNYSIKNSVTMGMTFEF